MKTKIKQWYTGFVDVKLSAPEDEDFSISMRKHPPSRLKRVIDWSWKFWRRQWGWLVSIFIAFIALIITIIGNWSALERFFTYLTAK